MLTVKCAMEEEIKQMTKDNSLEYRQQKTNWSIAKIEYFRQCIGFNKNLTSLPGLYFIRFLISPLRNNLGKSRNSMKNDYNLGA